MVTLSVASLIGLLVVIPACLFHFAIKQEQKWLDEIEDEIEELVEEEQHCHCCHCCGDCCKGDDNDEE